MNLVINIRGSNASGKSTVITEFIKNKKNNVFLLNDNYVTYLKEEDCYIIGRYDLSSGGCDRYSSFASVFEQIIFIIKNYHPKLILYEGMLLSKNVKKTYLLSKVSEKFGYSFCCLVLRRDFRNVIKLLEERNEGKEYDAANILKTYDAVLVSSKTLKMYGVKVIFKDVDGYKKEQMGSLIKEVLEKYE